MRHPLSSSPFMRLEGQGNNILCSPYENVPLSHLLEPASCFFIPIQKVTNSSFSRPKKPENLNQSDVWKLHTTKFIKKKHRSSPLCKNKKSTLHRQQHSRLKGKKTKRGSAVRLFPRIKQFLLIPIGVIQLQWCPGKTPSCGPWTGRAPSSSRPSSSSATASTCAPTVASASSPACRSTIQNRPSSIVRECSWNRLWYLTIPCTTTWWHSACDVSS